MNTEPDGRSAARGWPPKSTDSGIVKEFIDQFSGRLDWNVGTPSGCPTEGEADQLISSGSLKPGATALSDAEAIRRRVIKVGVQPPEKVPFCPIFSHDLAASFPCPSRAAGQPRSRAENRVAGQQDALLSHLILGEGRV